MPVEEKERVIIEKEAKLILDKFSKALANVSAEESDVVRDVDRREEGRMEKNLPNKSPSLKDSDCDLEFREIMFENASSKNKDFIMGEKKSW